MASSDLREALPLIAGSLPGMTEKMMLSTLRTAASVLLNKLRLTQETVFEDVQTGVSRYPINLPDDWFVQDIIKVWLCNECIEPMDIPCNEDACIKGYYFDGQDIEIFPLPEADIRDALKIRAYVVPSMSSCYIPTWVFEKYKHIIANMALSTSLSMANMPWFDPRMAIFYSDKATRELAEAETMQVASKHKGLRWTGNPWQ